MIKNVEIFESLLWNKSIKFLAVLQKCEIKAWLLIWIVIMLCLHYHNIKTTQGPLMNIFGMQWKKLWEKYTMWIWYKKEHFFCLSLFLLKWSLIKTIVNVFDYWIIEKWKKAFSFGNMGLILIFNKHLFQPKFRYYNVL